MTSALARMPRAQAIDVLRQQIAPKASDDELAFFAQVCARLDLSPFADQIVLIGRYDRQAGREVHRHQITVAGRRTLATRTGRLRGIEGPVWCGPRKYDGAPLEWSDLWDDDDGPPYCARCLVHVDGWVTPANGTAKWSEFAQRNKDGGLLRAWRAMPSHMLGKVAESMALRRAFPDTITAETVDGFDEVALAYARADGDRAELEDAAAAAGPVFPREETIDVDAYDDEDELERSGIGGTTTAAADARDPRPPSSRLDRAVELADQAAAHRAVAQLDPDARAAWLERFAIDDFGSSEWPAEAVEDALAMPFEGGPC